VAAVDSPIRLNACLLPGLSCERMENCPVCPDWARAQGAMLQVLDAQTIADLAAASVSPKPRKNP